MGPMFPEPAILIQDRRHGNQSFSFDLKAVRLRGKRPGLPTKRPRCTAKRRDYKEKKKERASRAPGPTSIIQLADKRRSQTNERLVDPESGEVAAGSLVVKIAVVFSFPKISRGNGELLLPRWPLGREDASLRFYGFETPTTRTFFPGK